jgi:hypothetical protein
MLTQPQSAVLLTASAVSIRDLPPGEAEFHPQLCGGGPVIGRWGLKLIGNVASILPAAKRV